MTKFEWIKNIKEFPQYYLEMFGNREITKALGLANHHTDCDEWLVATQNGKLLAFSGYELHNNIFILKRAFVFPPYRRLGLYKMMLDKRMEKAKELKCAVVQATATRESMAEFEKRGFFTTKNYKKYIIYRKIL